MVSNQQHENFTPTGSHRVCSAYFAGRKETYLNYAPTIVEKKTNNNNNNNKKLIERISRRIRR